MIAVASVVRALTWLASVPPPTDPLGPVDQDPEQIRNEACKVVSSNSSSCVTTTTAPPRPSSGGSGGADLSFLSLLLWLLLIAAVVAVVALLLRRPLARARRASEGEQHDDDDEVIDEGAVFVDRSREPVDWRSEADEHRRAGRFREALRCRYRALVGDLARRGLIDEIPGRTTGEHRRQVHEVTPVAAATFDRAADLFDGAWYGHADVDATDDDRFIALERDVLDGAGGRNR